MGEPRQRPEHPWEAGDGKAGEGEGKAQAHGVGAAAVGNLPDNAADSAGRGGDQYGIPRPKPVEEDEESDEDE